MFNQHGCTCPQGYVANGGICTLTEILDPTNLVQTVFDPRKLLYYGTHGAVLFNDNNNNYPDGDGTIDTIFGAATTY
jgi:hypothetical protein